MSTHHISAPALPKAIASLYALIAIVAAIAWISCGSDGQSEGDLDEYFLRDVAAVEAMGLPVYWLGTEFTVGGLVFRGPYVAEFGDEVEGGIHMSYLLDGGNSSLALTVYSMNAWSLAKERVENPKIPGEPRPVTRRTVSVGTREAELLSLPLATREVNQLWLILNMEDAVAVAVAGSGGPVYPGGPDYNPFINNPDLLIQVMEDLRPYPD